MDLKTKYMGLELNSPLVPSSSPLTGEIEGVKKLAEAGAGAVVLPSLFEEQIEHETKELDYYLHYGADRFAESLSYYPDMGEYKHGPEDYLEYIQKVKQAVDVPVIASLNGISAGGWTSYAEKMQQAGADALELNIYFLPTSPDVNGRKIEDVHASILMVVKSQVSIPVAVKLSPFFSAPINMLTRLEEAGADGLVLFNRFYQPDLDIDELAVGPNLKLSDSDDLLLPLRWVALAYGNLRCSLGLTSGVHTGRDAAKAILAGADVAMMCSSLLENGPDHLKTIADELTAYMESKDYESVAQMKGVLSQKKCAEPAAFERANYTKTLQSYGDMPILE